MHNFKHDIMQFGVIRSGSTLVYNILRHLFERVYKTHSVNYNENDLYILTIRHPYNCIISSILRFNQEINLENLQKHIDIFFDLNSGARYMLDLEIDKPNIILMYYEDFVDNNDYIFDTLIRKLNIKIDDDFRNKIKQTTCIENVKKISNNLGDFGTWDINTHIHGNHISKFNGKTDYKELLNEEEINLLKSNDNLNKLIDKFYKNSL